MPQQLAIEAEGLRKSYGDVHALRGVDLRIETGTVFGLLGPNGAGKTTAVRILTTLLPPDGGTARVAGFDIVREGAQLRAHIGLAGQYAAVDENLTGFENLEMVGRLYHLGRKPSRVRASELLEAFELTEAGPRLVRTYSGGMRRRLDLAAALVARPPVLFLDEPTTGLDLRSRIGLWDAIEELVSEGTTVLLTTQYLDEADRLAERIAVIDHGLAIAEGSPDELKAQVGGDRLEIRLDEPTTGLDLRSRIGLWDAIEELVSEGTTVLLTTQYLDEADRLAERLAVIDHGLAIAEGSPDELKAQVGGDRLEIRLDERGRDQEAIAALEPIAEERPFCDNGTLRVPLRRRGGVIAEAVRRLDEAGVGIEDIAVRRPTLDDVFLTLTGHAAEPSENGAAAEVEERELAPR